MFVENSRSGVMDRSGFSYEAAREYHPGIIYFAAGLVRDDEGPFSPERAGRVSCRPLIDLCYSGRYDHATMRRKQRGRGGFVAYFGTSSALEVWNRAQAGDAKAMLVYQALAYQVSKSIGELATVVKGKVDAILLTGGIAHSAVFCGWVEERVNFIASVRRYPGENELESLALGVSRVLDGEETAREFDLD